MKKKFMYICLMTGLFSSGILVNNLNAGNYTAEQVSALKPTLEEIKDQINNVDGKIFSRKNDDEDGNFVNDIIMKLSNLKINDNENFLDLCDAHAKAQNSNQNGSKSDYYKIISQIIKIIANKFEILVYTMREEINIYFDNMRVSIRVSGNAQPVLSIFYPHYQEDRSLLNYRLYKKPNSNEWEIIEELTSSWDYDYTNDINYRPARTKEQ